MNTQLILWLEGILLGAITGMLGGKVLDKGKGLIKVFPFALVLGSVGATAITGISFLFLTSLSFLIEAFIAVLGAIATIFLYYIVVLDKNRSLKS